MGTLFCLFYFVFCLLVAYVGRNTSIGFWGILALCILFSPLLVAIVMVVIRPRNRY